LKIIVKYSWFNILNHNVPLSPAFYKSANSMYLSSH